MRVHDNGVTFNSFRASNYPTNIDDCLRVDVVKQCANEEFLGSHPQDPLEASIMHETVEENDK